MSRIDINCGIINVQFRNDDAKKIVQIEDGNKTELKLTK